MLKRRTLIKVLVYSLSFFLPLPDKKVNTDFRYNPVKLPQVLCKVSGSCVRFQSRIDRIRSELQNSLIKFYITEVFHIYFKNTLYWEVNVHM